MAGELIPQFTEHEAKAKSRFIDQFKNKEKLAFAIASYAEQIQDLEDAAFEVIVERTLSSAVGVQLVTLARLVGAPVTTLVDAELRIIVQAQIAINLSDGTPEDLIKILALILSNSADEVFHITEEPTHQVRLVIEDLIDPAVLDPDTLIRLLDSADMGSIRILLDYNLKPKTTYLKFGDIVSGGGGQLGFGDSVSGGVGGFVNSVVENRNV